MDEIISRISSESESMRADIDGLPLLPNHLKAHEYDPIVVASVLGVPSAWCARVDMNKNQASGDASMMDKLLLEVSEAVEAASVASTNPDKMCHVEDKLTSIAAVCVRMLAVVKKI